MNNNLHLISDEVSNRIQLSSLLIQLVDKWWLRMRSYGFIMVVHKESGRYVNIYRNNLMNGTDLDTVADKLELHPKCK